MFLEAKEYQILGICEDGNGARSKLSNACTYQKCGVLGSGNIIIPKNRIRLSFAPNMEAYV